jgi:ubiquinone/menaquinone biosynthesis C-methylase UbiE
MTMRNVDEKVVKDFGNEWDTYHHRDVSDQEIEKTFDEYFHLFPFKSLPKNAQGFDMGCGSGRWAKLVAPKVFKLHCIDASAKAIETAKQSMKDTKNVTFEIGSVSGNSLQENSQDFGYSLGVLHHIPDTEQGIKDCSRLLKSGAPFLLYLYYNLENRPLWFRLIWKASDYLRASIARLPFGIKKWVTKIIAAFIYWPLARFSLLVEKLGLRCSNIPLNYYRHKKFYFMKTDALDRFGTRLEKRFSRQDIQGMLERNDFERITFSEKMPHWVCLGYKK